MSQQSHLGYIGWNLITEPDDFAARILVEHLGAAESWQWLTSRYRSGGSPEQIFQEMLSLSPGLDTKMLDALRRWLTRLETANPEAELERIAKYRAQVITPASPHWPEQLRHPQLIHPFALWVRGEVGVLKQPKIALVGARAATAYGEYVTNQLVEGLCDRNWRIISGGAYGIDAAAHRAARASDSPQVAVLAGGVDRYYPVGNSELLTEIEQSGGAVISEMPLGAAPRRVRFLQRNRLIAALAAATVVVEAAWRSGALSTARHAAELNLPVGAVPGPVTSMASSGCHRLIRDSIAQCVTDAAEVHELAGALEVNAPLGDAGLSPATPGLWDELDATAKRVLDAMPLKRATTPEKLAQLCGLPGNLVLGALGQLSMLGAVQAVGANWRKL